MRGLVLPVEGAPLIYATEYAHDMALRLKRADGTFVDIPLHAGATVGGFVRTARSRPVLSVRPPRARSTAAGVSRRSTDPPSCCRNPTTPAGRRRIAPRSWSAAQQADWKQSGPNGIVATLPLEKADPGTFTILVSGKGADAPTVLTLRAFQETGSLDDFDLHAGDAEAVLSGSRLDQVQGATLGSLAFRPGALTRVGRQDRLTLQAADPAAVAALAAGKTATADVTFANAATRRSRPRWGRRARA